MFSLLTGNFHVLRRRKIISWFLHLPGIKQSPVATKLKLSVLVKDIYKTMLNIVLKTYTVYENVKNKRNMQRLYSRPMQYDHVQDLKFV